MTRTAGLDRWWPTTQAFELVRAPVDAVAAALRSDVERSLGDEPLVEEWRSFTTLDQAFCSVDRFTSVPTAILAFATDSDWTVLWSNGFHCTGYDAIAAGLTRLHGFETLHVCAHDVTTTTPAAGGFTHRVRSGAEVVERSVHSWCSGGRWVFVEAGRPLPEEDLAGYLSPEMSERLDERALASFVQRKGARPWDETFYRLAPDRTWRLERPAPPSTIECRAPETVRTGAPVRATVPQR